MFAEAQTSEKVIYYPNQGFVGSDTCTYEACEWSEATEGWIDGGACVTATVDIQVNEMGSAECPEDIPPETPSPTKKVRRGMVSVTQGMGLHLFHMMNLSNNTFYSFFFLP